jgi:hypothetical protein
MPWDRTFIIDRPMCELHPNMPKYPMLWHWQTHEGDVRPMIDAVLTSRLGVSLIAGAILAAPSRPPIVALEPFLAELVGDKAFSVEMKKYTGRLLKQVIEHLGGTFVRRAVKVTVPSRYRSGSIYRFGKPLQIRVLDSD